MEIYFIALSVLMIGALLQMPFKDEWKFKICSVFSGIGTLLLLIPSLYVLFGGEVLSQSIYISPVFGEINFVIDQLSAFFIMIISVMTFWGVIYANGYMKQYFATGAKTSSHCLFLILLIISMIGVVTVQNFLFFLVVWEIMSLSSFFLVIFEENKKEVIKAGIKYLVYMHISLVFIMLAFALLAIYSKSYDFANCYGMFKNHKHLSDIVFILALIGFGTKAGFVPFHNWLPDAHPAAPTHVSGIMSGVMIKTGIYGILRTLYLILPSRFIAYTLLIVSIISAMYGVIYAITQHNIKRLLAYHSIENIGIIGIGLGIGLLGALAGNPLIGVLGFCGGIFHILNHSIFKELLFFTAGSIYNKTHTLNIDNLGGLIKKMPCTALFFVIGSVAICGVPPFNGFVSEFIIYASMILGLPALQRQYFVMMIIALASLAIIGTMAILCFTKATGVIFLGNPRTEYSKNVQEDVGKTMLIPMGILALLSLLIGIFPQYFIMPVLSVVNMFIYGDGVSMMLYSIVKMVQTLSFLFFIFFTIFLAVGIGRYFCNKGKSTHSTWGCGYDKPTSRMQYSASSYVELFLSTLRPMFKRVTHIKNPKGLFPKEAYYEVEIEDIEEAYIVKPLIKLDEKILTKFERIQNGNMQQYILFGLVFLVIALAGLIIFN